MYSIKFRRYGKNTSKLANVSENLKEKEYINYFKFYNLTVHIRIKITELISENLECVLTDSKSRICKTI